MILFILIIGGIVYSYKSGRANRDSARCMVGCLLIPMFYIGSSSIILFPSSLSIRYGAGPITPFLVLFIGIVIVLLVIGILTSMLRKKGPIIKTAKFKSSCSFCGYPITRRDQFCEHCGKNLKELKKNEVS